MRLYILSVFFLFFYSCHTPEASNRVLKPGNLKSFYVKIDASEDTLLLTPKGGAVFIRKGTFDEDVELEIKEAYTMKDILLAGLVTESDGKPLQSGGMIYINEKDGKPVKVNNPISVAIPTNYIQEEMELYKGEVEQDSSINWVKEDSLIPTKKAQTILAGKQIHVQNCSSCHQIKGASPTAPRFAGMMTRGPWRDKKQLTAFIANPPAFKHPYTDKLKKQYGYVMTGFPNLAQQDIDAFVAFIENEEKQPVTDTFAIPVPEVQEQPCNDTVFYDEEDTLELPFEVIQEMGVSAEESLRRGFTDRVISDGAYRFEIQTLGWYNVDAEMRGLPNTSLCDLTVQLKGDPKNTDMIVYVFFPTTKDLTVGTLAENQYTFKKYDGRIPLYLGSKGVVVSFGNYRDQFYYGIQSFTVQPTQNVVVDIKPSTEQELLEAIEKEQLEGINMDIVKRQMKVVPCNQLDSDTLRR